LQGPKTTKKNTGTKTKTRHICGDQNHILALILLPLNLYSV